MPFDLSIWLLNFVYQSINLSHTVLYHQTPNIHITRPIYRNHSCVKASFSIRKKKNSISNNQPPSYENTWLLNQMHCTSHFRTTNHTFTVYQSIWLIKNYSNCFCCFVFIYQEYLKVSFNHSLLHYLK